MSYSYNNYIVFGITVPIVIATLALVVAVFVVLYFSRIKAGPFTKVSPIAAFLLMCILMIAIMYPSLPFLEHLPSEKEMAPLEDIVQIEAVEDTSFFPLYFDKGHKNFLSAKIITSKRGLFYGVNTTGLQTGDYIYLSYLPYSRAVLKSKIVTEAIAKEYWETHSEPPVVSDNKENHENGYEGIILFFVFFAVVGKVVLIEILIVPITNLLNKKRENVEGFIRPRLFGKLEKGYTEIIFLFATILSFGTESTILGIVFLFLAVGYGYYMLEIFTSSATYSEDQFCFKSIGTALSVKRSEIINVCWTSPKNISGLVLTVYLKGAKTIYFPQIDFIGLDGFLKWVKGQNTADDSLISSETDKIKPN